LLEDALDGEVAWLTEVDSALASGFQAFIAIAFAQSEESARCAQAVDRRVVQ
jgi:hypothetical protein